MKFPCGVPPSLNSDVSSFLVTLFFHFYLSISHFSVSYFDFGLVIPCGTLSTLIVMKSLLVQCMRIYMGDTHTTITSPLPPNVLFLQKLLLLIGLSEAAPGNLPHP